MSDGEAAEPNGEKPQPREPREGPSEPEVRDEPEPPRGSAEPAVAEVVLGPPARRPGYFRIGFVGALGVLVAWLMVQALVGVRGVLVYILVALFLAVGLNPMIEFLRDRARMPRWAAILTVCLALVAFVAVFVWAIVPPLSAQVTSLVAGLLYERRVRKAVHQAVEDEELRRAYGTR
jgi:hypothetical protein